MSMYMYDLFSIMRQAPRSHAHRRRKAKDVYLYKYIHILICQY